MDKLAESYYAQTAQSLYNVQRYNFLMYYCK